MGSGSPYFYVLASSLKCYVTKLDSNQLDWERWTNNRKLELKNCDDDWNICRGKCNLCGMAINYKVDYYLTTISAGCLSKDYSGNSTSSAGKCKTHGNVWTIGSEIDVSIKDTTESEYRLEDQKDYENEEGFLTAVVCTCNRDGCNGKWTSDAKYIAYNAATSDKPMIYFLILIPLMGVIFL